MQSRAEEAAGLILQVITLGPIACAPRYLYFRVAGRIVVKLLERDGGQGAFRPEERHHHSQAFGGRPVVAGAVVNRVQTSVGEEHLASRNNRSVARQFVVELDAVVGGYVEGSGSKRHKHVSAGCVVQRRRGGDGSARAGVHKAPVAADSHQQLRTIRLAQHSLGAPRLL
eukprot:scaffold101544_cov60-Phaeocystis_antarctica.AAC.1